MYKKINLFINLYIIAQIVYWSWILFQVFYPFTIFKINTLPLPIINTQVKMGDTVVYKEDYCKYVGSAGNVTHSLQRQLTDTDKKNNIQDYIVVLDTLQNINVPLGCHDIIVPVNIPSDLTPGTYRILKSIHVKVNQFRQVDLEFKSEWFKVI